MKNEFKKLTSKEFRKGYIPTKGLILIARDKIPEKVGSIIMTTSTQKSEQRYAWTGVIVGLNDFFPEDKNEQYVYSILFNGLRIGFGNMTPKFAPCPPNTILDNPDGPYDDSYTLHCHDIMCLLPESEEQKKEILKRIQKANEV